MKRPVISSRAASKESARKKIHARQTKWKVRSRARHRVHAVAGAGGRLRRRSAHQRSPTSAAPWSPPRRRRSGAVPEAADEHRQQQVAVGETASRGCRRAGCRRSPAASERASCATGARVLHRRRGVRRVEVLREREPEQQGDLDRDVGVPREVGVDLDGVRVDGDQDLQGRVLPWRREDLVDDRRGEVFAITTFLKKPGRDQVEGAARVDVAQDCGACRTAGSAPPAARWAGDNRVAGRTRGSRRTSRGSSARTRRDRRGRRS